MIAPELRCPQATRSSGGRTMQCQSHAGHEGQCFYRRRGNQGGTVTRWWGANPRPVGWTGDLGHTEMLLEISRLRGLCERSGIDWKEGLK